MKRSQIATFDQAVVDFGDGGQAPVFSLAGPDGQPLSPGGARSTFYTGQKKIVATGTPVQIGDGLTVNGVCVTAYVDNADVVTVGGSTVTATKDGTGNGYRLQPGQSQVFPVTNLNQLFINGVAGDSVDFSGN